MRTKSKPNTGKPGISTANAYRASVKSAATDLEAMVDAYGLNAVILFATRIRDQIALHGDCLSNALFNSELNALPLPELRKQHNPANRAKSRKKA